MVQLLDSWLYEADGTGSARQAVHLDSQLVLAVPGLTIPWTHAGYLWISVAVSLCVHEVSPFRTAPQPMLRCLGHLGMMQLEAAAVIWLTALVTGCSLDMHWRRRQKA
jgi:hypothetical protein